MFDRATNTPERISTKNRPTSAELDVYEEKAAKKIEKQLKRRNSLVVKLSATALTVSSLLGAYWLDVIDNRAEREAAEISINVISGPLDESNEHTATILAGGFNMQNADFMAKTIGPGIQELADGEIWSLSYNNAILSRTAISSTILDFAEERGIEKLNFIGYSTGGIVTTEATADIIKDSDIPVEISAPISTPDGPEGVRSNQKQGFELIQSLASIPGAVDSSYVRLVCEMYFFNKNYTKNGFEDLGGNTERFFETLNAAIDRLDDPKQTSMKLLIDQAYKISSFDMKKELKTISEQSEDKQMPVFAYFGTQKPGYDFMVDDKLSAKNFGNYAKKADISFQTFLVPGAIHAEYYKTVDAYADTFSEANTPIVKDIEAEKARRAFILIAQEQESNKSDDKTGAEAQK